MNNSVKLARTALMMGSLVLAAVIMGYGGGSVFAGSDGPRPATPLEAFTQPINVSQNGAYDNTPWIAASPLNGAVTIAWEQRDEAGGRWGRTLHRSNLSLNTPLLPLQSLEEADARGNGNTRVASDSLGRRWIIWFQIDGGETCGRIARVDTDGIARLNETVPGTCTGNNFGRKNTALAVGPDNSVHALFGHQRNDFASGNIFYYRMQPGGAWDVTGQEVGGYSDPKNLAIGVSSQGTVMVAYVDNNDIHTTVRQANGTWEVRQNVSGPICGGASQGHLPALARDSSGGLRIVFGENCPVRDPGADEVYYREWVPGTGWNSQPIVQITNNNGNSYYPAIAVDTSGVAHIAWGDDTGRGNSNFQVNYAKGRGTNFTNQEGIVSGWFPNGYMKEPSISVSPAFGGGYAAVHIAFGSNYGDSYRENWYTHAQTDGGTPTHTPTATPTVTPCTMPAGEFRDVLQSDYFYVPVRQLALAGVISGYGDCTFRPYNNITRGQAAKIVVLGAELETNTNGGPHFTDVATTHTFYEFIESAFNAGVVSGYNCGGPGEPCDSQNRPYFRPGANVTRGQFAKMVVSAFDFPIDTTGGPHFSDVPVSNAFYTFVETAYHRELISGYADGTFRPNNTIVRGQAAKIVYQGREQAATTPTATGTPPTNTPIVVTSTVTDTPFVVTATPSNTPIVVTSTATDTPFVVTATPTNTPVVATTTNTPSSGDGTSTATDTPVPDTATPTDTPTV